MTSSELITLFSKGNENLISLSLKQRDWLLSVAKKEGILKDCGHGIYEVSIGEKRYKIRQASVFASGGSYIGRRKLNSFRCELYYYIRFTDTGLTAYYNYTDIEYYKSKNFQFEII